MITVTVCIECGSITWEEIVFGVRYTYTTDVHGETVEIDRDNFGECRFVCAECECDDTLREVDLKPDEVKKFISMSNVDRLVWLVKQVAVHERKFEFLRIEDIKYIVRRNRGNKKFNNAIKEFKDDLLAFLVAHHFK